MTCDDAVGLLLPALQGLLAPAEQQALGGHAAECPVCSKELPEIQETWAVLDAWTDEEPPRALLESVLRKLEKERR